MNIQVASSAFSHGQRIPPRYTWHGRNMSPPLHWSDPPNACKSQALICLDSSRHLYHWILYNLYCQARYVNEALPSVETLASGSKHGLNDFGQVGYCGPVIKKGESREYQFKVVALNDYLELPCAITGQIFETAIDGLVLAEGELVGYFRL